MRRLASAFVALLLLGCVSVAPAPQELVHEAAIASAHPLATAAGHEVLAAGGNAFDAAIAVSAALSVVEPYSSGLGGGGFYLLHRTSDGNEVFLDARETAPAAATQDMYLDADGEPVAERQREGALAAGIPGTPAALVHLAQNYGALPLSRNLAPAVRLAREGFAVDARFASITARSAGMLRRYGTEAFFISGRPPQEGEVLRQPDLADTLEALGEDHGESFYRGRTAQALVAGVRAAGGIWTEADLAQYRVIERSPLVGHYQGHRIVTAPPPSSGGTVLLATLNILAGFDYETMDPLDRAHLLVESWRRTFRDRSQYIGDPAFVDVPVERLVSLAHAESLRRGIDLARATPSAALAPAPAPGGGESTTHFSILDAHGNRVAATQTVNFRYGAGLMPAGTGVVLNNEMYDFVARTGSPDGFELVSQEANLVGPGRRPVSSMTPTIIAGPRGVAIIGTPGGSRIISMVTLSLLAWVEGQTPSEMVGLPRFHHQYLPDVIMHEPDVELAALAARGHAFRAMSRRYGNMNVVAWERDGNRVTAATDPRNTSLVDF